MSNINDLLGAAINKSPVDFTNTVYDLLQQKAEAAIDDRRIEVAQSIYGSEDDVSDNDIDLDDLDVADLDLDLEDIGADVENA